jgi:hypothetical protein
LERVITYIDGYNLYYGLRSKHWQRFYWLNLQALSRSLLKSNQSLVSTKYFTTIVKSPDDRRRRQALFLEALGTLPNFYSYYGHFLEDIITCRHCGHTHQTYHEKMTDVNIAVEMMADAFQDRFDLALLISADSDLAGLLENMQRLFPAKRFIVAFPPGRHSNALRRIAHATLRIGPNELSKSLFTGEVVRADGVILRCPPRWR